MLNISLLLMLILLSLLLSLIEVVGKKVFSVGIVVGVDKQVVVKEVVQIVEDWSLAILAFSSGILVFFVIFILDLFQCFQGLLMCTNYISIDMYFQFLFQFFYSLF